MNTKETITNKLREAFTPESLDVTDESHLHEGHAGHRPGGETHFRVYIVSPAFKGKSRVERHRMINAALAGELAGSVHALAIKAQDPGESGCSASNSLERCPCPPRLFRLDLGFAGHRDDPQRG